MNESAARELLSDERLSTSTSQSLSISVDVDDNVGDRGTPPSVSLVESPTEFGEKAHFLEPRAPGTNDSDSDDYRALSSTNPEELNRTRR